MSIQINGTLINYYFHCKTQLWYYANKINMEYNSSYVKIGKAMHSTNKKIKEVKVANIAMDKVSKDYIVEVKKSDSDLTAAKWQLLYYLYTLKQKGIDKKGKIEVIEKNIQQRKTFFIELTPSKINKIMQISKDIKKIASLKQPPKPVLLSKCQKCAYYELCFI